MPTTRAQEKAAVSGEGSKEKEPRVQSETNIKSTKPSDDAPPPKKRQRKVEDTSEGIGEKSSTSTSNAKLKKLIEAHGQLPLEMYGLPDPLVPTPRNMLANLFHAMLTSARISHGIAAKSVKTLLDNNYHELHTLKQSSWEERCDVLTEGGYAHYRERTSTQLGDLARLISDKYDGDLNSLPEKHGETTQGVRRGLEEVNGIGKVGSNVFIDTAQAYWTFLAPFLDERSLESVKKMGLAKGDDIVKELWQGVGEDPLRFARLANAVTYVRLEGGEHDFA